MSLILIRNPFFFNPCAFALCALLSTKTFKRLRRGWLKLYYGEDSPVQRVFKIWQMPGLNSRQAPRPPPPPPPTSLSTSYRASAKNNLMLKARTVPAHNTGHIKLVRGDKSFFLTSEIHSVIDKSH